MRGWVWGFALASCQFSPPPIGGDGAAPDGPGPVDGSGPPADAPPDGLPPPDARVDAITYDCNETACEAANGRCTAQGLCLITSTNGDAVICTSGLTCDIHCTGSSDACNGGVDCLDADGCFIECGQSSACRDGGVKCGGAFCDVTCHGDNACRSGVTCSAACCRIDCQGSNACRDGEVACVGSSSCVIQCHDGTNTCGDAGAACDVGSCRLNVCSVGVSVAWDCGSGATCMDATMCSADLACPM